MHRTALRNDGFTLVEVLVVISIIALLIAILLPALGKSRTTARRSACTQQIRQNALALAMRATDTDGTMPLAEIHSNGPGNGIYGMWNRNLIDLPSAGQYRGLGIAVIEGYFSEPRSLYCPAWDHPNFRFGVYNGGYAGGWPKDNNPSATGQTQINGSYHYRASRDIDLSPNARPVETWSDPAGLMLLADHFSMRGADVLSHHQDGYSASYLDGHTEFLYDPNEQVRLANGGASYNTSRNGYRIQERISVEFFDR